MKILSTLSFFYRIAVYLTLLIFLDRDSGKCYDSGEMNKRLNNIFFGFSFFLPTDAVSAEEDGSA